MTNPFHIVKKVTHTKKVYKFFGKGFTVEAKSVILIHGKNFSFTGNNLCASFLKGRERGRNRMKCMFCGWDDSRVIDSRPTDEGLAIRRRRECIKCGRRFTTYEKIENPEIIVVKKDGSREVFDADKIRRGVIKACEKRQVTTSQIDALVRDVEQQLQNALELEVASTKIGELVMDRLKDLDEVAYVRFASVYRSFCDVNTFMQELQKLVSKS